MEEDFGANLLPLWISETDERGNRVHPEVIQSAHRIWGRALHYIRCQGHDLAPVAEVLESTCHCVSRAIRRNRDHDYIRDLDSYLFWAFARRYNRRIAREERIEYVSSMEAFAAGRFELDQSWVSMLHDDIQLDQFLGLLKPKIRIMLIRRLQRESWSEIGAMFGITGHNAEVQFANAIKKARMRLFGKDWEKTGRGRR